MIDFDLWGHSGHLSIHVFQPLCYLMFSHRRSGPVIFGFAWPKGPRSLNPKMPPKISIPAKVIFQAWLQAVLKAARKVRGAYLIYLLLVVEDQKGFVWKKTRERHNKDRIICSVLTPTQFFGCEHLPTKVTCRDTNVGDEVFVVGSVPEQLGDYWTEQGNWVFCSNDSILCTFSDLVLVSTFGDFMVLSLVFWTSCLFANRGRVWFDDL